MASTSSLLVVVAACVAAIAFGTLPVDSAAAPMIWPVPTSYDCVQAAQSLAVDKQISFVTNSSSGIVKSSLSRAQHFVQTRARNSTAVHGSKSSSTLYSVFVSVVSDDETLDNETDYSYSVSMHKDERQLRVSAATPFGAVASMASVMQLLMSGSLPCQSLAIDDKPTFSLRGLRVDVASRYFQVDLVKKVIDGMSAVKMNTLLLHFADYGAARAEMSGDLSPITDNLKGQYPHHVLKSLTGYAKSRGVRLMPSMELPMHGSGLAPLTSTEYDISFCESPKLPSGQRVTITPNENGRMAMDAYMAALNERFDDQAFYVGGANVKSVSDNCTAEDLYGLVSHLVNGALDAGRVPAIDATALGPTKNVTASKVIGVVRDNNLTSASVNDVVSRGAHAILAGLGGTVALPTLQDEAAHEDLYSYFQDFTKAVTGKFQLKFFLGVAAVMSATDFCPDYMCGAMPGNASEASFLARRKLDKYFSDAVLGLIFPNTTVTAGAAWNFVNVTKLQFDDYIDHANTFLKMLDINSCPAGCVCTPSSRCGNAYPSDAPTQPVIQGGFIFGICILCVNVSFIAFVLYQRHASGKGDYEAI